MLCGRQGLPKPQDQGQDIAMPDAASDSAPHGGQDQDGQLDPVQPPNPESPGLGQQKGQQQEDPANHNAMIGNVPPEIIKRLECKCLLERLGFSIDGAQATVLNHGCDTAKKLSHLMPNDIDILMKTLRFLDGECADGTKAPNMSVPHLARCVLISM